MFSRLSSARALLRPALGAAGLSGVFALTSYDQPQPAHCLLGFGSSAADWTKIKEALVELCDDESAPNPSVDNASGSLGGGGYVAPMLVRLAWHSSGSYSKLKNDGGSQGGTIRFEPEINHGGNAGLKHAIGVLAPIKENNPGVSWAGTRPLCFPRPAAAATN